jgi:hypothetical protein
VAHQGSAFDQIRQRFRVSVDVLAAATILASAHRLAWPSALLRTRVPKAKSHCNPTIIFLITSLLFLRLVAGFLFTLFCPISSHTSSFACRHIYFWKVDKVMRNPWIKKNPFLSMWLSAANSVAGSARGRAAAEAKRQAATMMSEGTKQVANFWGNALMPRPPAKKKKRR